MTGRALRGGPAWGVGEVLTTEDGGRWRVLTVAGENVELRALNTVNHDVIWRTTTARILAQIGAAA